MNRLKFYENTFSAKALFFTGLVIMPALLFNSRAELSAAQFIFFWLLVFLSGKKTNVIFSLFVIAAIIVFNLIAPYGRVLYSLGGFKITQGALRSGIHRSFTLGALVMFSKVTVRHDLKIPGAFGDLLGETLHLFYILMSRKHRITGKNFIENIDSLLLELSAGDVSAPVVQQVRTKPAGFAVLLIVIILSWLPMILTGMQIFVC